MCSPKAPAPRVAPPPVTETVSADPVDLRVGKNRKDSKKRRGLSALRLAPSAGGTSANGVNLG